MKLQNSVLLVSLPLALAPALAAAETLSGTWLGTLDAGAMKLRIGMESVEASAGGLSMTFVSIDQGGVRIPSVEPKLVAREITAPLPMIHVTFRGKLNAVGDKITGTWEQGGMKLPLKLVKVDRLPTQLRPQEPKPPFPYTTEEVAFTNPKGGHTLAGTLTLPPTPGPHAAIVLVTGSGPQDRDETIMGHKPFAVLADAITRRGVAVLRYDDRGVGKSMGDFASATSADLATDALAAVRFLAGRDDISAERVGVGGHSEGAMIAPIVAADFPGEVAFIVLLAPPAITGEETIVTQGLAIERRMGMPEAEALAQAELRRSVIQAAIKADTEAEFRAKLEASVEVRVTLLPEGEIRDSARKSLLDALPAFREPWFRYMLGFDPTGPLKKVACPVLAILGENDVQVLPDENLAPLRAALGAAPSENVHIELLPGLNHLLQTSETGLPSEYGEIEETIAPLALNLIADWVEKQAGQGH